MKPFLRANTAHTEEYAKLRSEHAEEAWRASMATHDEMQRLSDEVKASYARQDELRARQRRALTGCSNTFGDVLRVLLGEGVRGRVETSGRKLMLHVDHHGKRESAAIETVKLLAFDLAALTASIQGQGAHPHLLNDGPR